MIRKAKIEDVIRIVDIEKKVFSQTLGETFLYDEITLNPFAHYFVYEKELQVVAYIGFRATDETSEMMNFAVDPEYQGQHIGTELLHVALNYLKDLNVKLLTLEVRKSNVKAQTMYERFGFVKSHIRKHYYEHEDAIVYVKEVSS